MGRFPWPCPTNGNSSTGPAFSSRFTESVCSAFIALNGVPLLIGIGAFAAASSALKLADRMHIYAIRIPMMLLALAGSLLNLIVLWQIWRLRRRPASTWPQQPVSTRKKTSEWLPFTLSVLTLFQLAPDFSLIVSCWPAADRF